MTFPPWFFLGEVNIQKNLENLWFPLENSLQTVDQTVDFPHRTGTVYLGYPSEKYGFVQ